jgi:hypothetical protein
MFFSGAPRTLPVRPGDLRFVAMSVPRSQLSDLPLCFVAASVKHLVRLAGLPGVLARFHLMLLLAGRALPFGPTRDPGEVRCVLLVLTVHADS